MVTEHFRIVQVKLANELQKPLFLHCRDAAERFAAVLQEQELGVPAVAHCFTGSREELVLYIEIGAAHRHHWLGKHQTAVASIKWMAVQHDSQHSSSQPAETSSTLHVLSSLGGLAGLPPATCTLWI